MNSKKYFRLDSCPSMTDTRTSLPKTVPLAYASTSRAMACSSDLLSPCSDCSSEENNSPTALNSFRWEKPDLEDKALEFSWTAKSRHHENSADRPWSNGYVNLQTDSDDQEENEGSIIRRENCPERQPIKVEDSLLKCASDERDVSCKKFDSKRIFSSDLSKEKSDEDDEGSDSYHLSPPTPTEKKEDIIAKLKKEEESLKKVPWFQIGIPREVALDVLSGKPEGSFIVRRSTTKPGCYALSLRVPPQKNQSGIAHYLIMHTNKGFKIKGFTKEFSSLQALITHHSVMPELLPCTLILPRKEKDLNLSRKDDDLDFVNSDQADRCSLFSDIHWIMNDLKL